METLVAIDDRDGVVGEKHPGEFLLAGYLDGVLSEAQRVELDAHLEQCAACRSALADAVSVLHVPEATTTTGSGRRVPRSWRVAGLMAGALLAASLVGIIVMRPGGRDANHSGVDSAQERVPAINERLPVLDIVEPREGDALSASRRFVWHPATADQYRFVLLGFDGRQVWSRITGDTALVLPPEVHLELGATYFWYVDATSGTLKASTGHHRLTIPR
jgi:hypothetical protein